jgi:adenine-specific DNA-methyltransferase
LVWFSKTKENTKFFNPTTPKSGGPIGSGQYVFIEPSDYSQEPRRMTAEELDGSVPIPDGWRILAHDTLYSQGSPSDPNDEVFVWRGKTFRCPSNTHWKPGVKSGGMAQLAKANRLMLIGNTLRYKRYLNDFLVLDITCGSGTSAYVGEQWGRRWITCDTSRVPLALARQRLLTATFPWYKLKNPAQGPAGGFVYERKLNRKGEDVGGRIPHLTLSSIANNQEPEMATLVDRPEVNDKITRVCGPFTVEATIQAALTLTDEGSQSTGTSADAINPRAYLDRMIEVLRQSKSLRLPGNTSLELDAVLPLSDREHLHAEATVKNGSDKRIAIVFGPEDGAIGSEYVFNASMEAMQQGFQQLFLFGFAIQAKAREMLDKLKIPTIYVAMTPDVVMSDLLKTSRSSEIFSITGLPDVEIKDAGKRADGTELHQVEVKGLDIFRPDTMETAHIDSINLPCWMLDTDYNNMVFCASQVFFPKTSAWDNLQKSLKGDYNDSVWEHLAGTLSEPFTLGDNRRIAVKVIDDRGNELMVVKSADGAA